MSATHKELVKIAGTWLSKSKGCNPVFLEKGSAGCSEIPDAIGWTSKECLIVECKTSITDLWANSKKNLKLGDKRYFLMEWELYDKCREMIVPTGYGIITIANIECAGRMERFKDSIKFVSCLNSEIRYLRSRILEVQRFGTI